MRYIAIFLLLANIAYLAWSYFVEEAPVARVASAPRPLLNSGLILLSEYQQQLAELLAESCFTVASFESTDEATSFIGELDQRQFAASLRLTGEMLDSRYRVFLAPASSRGIATITLDSLSDTLAAARLQIESYLITRGSLENCIALGVFAQRDNAQQVQNQLLALGYAAEIEEIPRSTGEIQVWLQLLQADAMENPEWLELTASRPDLRIMENLCETIAQGSQFP